MSAQQVRIMCPNLVCRKVLAVPESLRGKVVACKACSTNIRVPTKTASLPKPGTAPGQKAA
jgi:hypothetical protein